MGAGIIKARQKPFELFGPDGNDFFPGAGPGEPMFLQTFMPNTESVMIPVKDLDHVPPSVAENKQVPCKKILVHDLLDHNR